MAGARSTSTRVPHVNGGCWRRFQVQITSRKQSHDLLWSSAIVAVLQNSFSSIVAKIFQVHLILETTLITSLTSLITLSGVLHFANLSVEIQFYNFIEHYLKKKFKQVQLFEVVNLLSQLMGRVSQLKGRERNTKYSIIQIYIPYMLTLFFYTQCEIFAHISHHILHTILRTFIESPSLRWLSYLKS